MPTTQLTCPHCGSTLNFGKEIAAGTLVECLICMQTFAVNHGITPAPVPMATHAPGKPPPVVSAAKTVPNPPSSLPEPVKTNRAGKAATPGRRSENSEPYGKAGMLVVTFAFLVLLSGGIAFAVWKMSDWTKHGESRDDDHPVAAVNKDGAQKNPTDNSEKPAAEKKDNPAKKTENNSGDDEGADNPKKTKDGKPLLKRKNPAKSDEKDPELGNAPITKIQVLKKEIAGVDQEKINAAIDKGSVFLKKTQNAEGSWGGRGFPVGYGSLAGLTLLECHTPANDPSVQRTAGYVRSNLANLEKTYEISLAILFLDRLGEARDRPLIQALALRLLAGQLLDGGWEYECPSLQTQEMQQLLAFLQSHKSRIKKGLAPAALGPNLRNLPVVQNLGKLKGQHVLGESRSDNSNTQFALLALWAARRHGVPTEQALLAAYDRFVLTQCSDGGWEYFAKSINARAPGSPLTANASSTNTMTCVGLLALAMGHGVSPELDGAKSKDGNEPVIKPALGDAKIRKALAALGRHIGHPVDAGKLRSLPVENLYFLWSVERVAMLFDVDTVDGKDWYGWGAQSLLRQQGPDGRWGSAFYAGHDPMVNTCFALLFLRRSNLVQDLTVTLRLNSGIRDPEK
jgi:hypothetical protein